MPRIGAQSDDVMYEDEDEVDLDTAGRLREGRLRTSLHEMRDGDADARNTPRQEAHSYVWKPPTSMDAPEPRPGFVQRWIRAEFRSDSDNLNWQSRMREGWVPRNPATVPDAELWFGNAKHMDVAVIRVGGSILCEKPIERSRAKQAAIREAAKRQEDSVRDDTARVSREGMREGMRPIVHEEQSLVKVGRRRTPPTMA